MIKDGRTQFPMPIACCVVPGALRPPYYLLRTNLITYCAPLACVPHLGRVSCVEAMTSNKET